jgi:MFS family permease
MIKKYLTILFLAFSILIYLLPYMNKVFYIQFQREYRLTNIQIGTLISYYAITSIPSYIIGGWVADHFSAKLMVVLSCVLTGILGMFFSIAYAYNLLIFIFLCFGLTTSLLYWSAYYKLIKTLGSQSEQGRIFGFNEAAFGITNLTVSYCILGALTGLSLDFRKVVFLFSAVLILQGMLILIFFKEKSDLYNKSDEIDLKLIPKVMSLPITWLNSFIIMGLYIMTSCTVYFSPYLAQVYLFSAAMASGLQIVYSNGVRIILSPLGGAIRDKVGSSAPLLIAGFATTVVLGLGFQFIPQNPTYFISFIVLSLTFCALIFLMNSSTYTISSEAKVPIKMTGTMWGIVSAVSYSTDLWLFKLCGMWLDKLGTAGYYRIFLLMIGGAVLALVSTIFLLFYLRKQKTRKSS